MRRAEIAHFSADWISRMRPSPTRLVLSNHGRKEPLVGDCGLRRESRKVHQISMDAAISILGVARGTYCRRRHANGHRRPSTRPPPVASRTAGRHDKSSQGLLEELNCPWHSAKQPTTIGFADQAGCVPRRFGVSLSANQFAALYLRTISTSRPSWFLPGPARSIGYRGSAQPRSGHGLERNPHPARPRPFDDAGLRSKRSRPSGMRSTLRCSNRARA